MPQASDEDRNKMAAYFGGDGISDSEPLGFLIENGWADYRGMLVAPKRNVTQKELDCVGFLCDEWDYGYDPKLTIQGE